MSQNRVVTLDDGCKIPIEDKNIDLDIAKEILKFSLDFSKAAKDDKDENCDNCNNCPISKICNNLEDLAYHINMIKTQKNVLEKEYDSIEDVAKKAEKTDNQKLILGLEVEAVNSILEISRLLKEIIKEISPEDEIKSTKIMTGKFVEELYRYIKK